MNTLRRLLSLSGYVLKPPVFGLQTVFKPCYLVPRYKYPPGHFPAFLPHPVSFIRHLSSHLPAGKFTFALYFCLFMQLEYKIIQPDPLLADYVEAFWTLANPTGEDQEIVVLPDGRVDLIFFRTAGEPFRAMLMAIDSQAAPTVLRAGARMTAVSFTLPAVEDIFHTKIGAQEGEPVMLPAGFWGITADDTDDFEACCEKFTRQIRQSLTAGIDPRKQQLFQLIYASNGAMPIKELSQKVFWSSRQINRYFNQTFGLSLKAYCNILRFRASFQPLSEGKLFPEEGFTDQNHFIKDIKKHAGVTPKALSRNKDGRFVHITILQSSSS